MRFAPDGRVHLNFLQGGVSSRHEKVRIARRLREETTMTLKWIVGEFHMGAWTHVSNLPSQAGREEK